MKEIQGSEEWFSARLGRATASRFSAVLAKGKEGKTRAKYLRQIVIERLTGVSQETFSGNVHTDRGKDQEPFARMHYEAATGNLVNEVGFIRHPFLMSGASPDGLIDLNGGTEIKSVIPSIQIEIFESGGYPSTNKAQVQGCLWICEREWWDFVRYSPTLPENLRLYIFRVHRDEEYIKNLEAEVIRFLDEAEALYQRLLNIGGSKNVITQ